MHYTFLLAGIDNGMMEKKFFLYIAVIISTFSMQTMAGDIDHTVNLKNWKKVTLIYFRDFPYQQYWNVQPPFKCFFSLSAGSVIRPVWRCRERIGLLRPATLVNHWKQEQDSEGVFDFSLPGSSIYHVAAHIESVSSAEENMAARLHTVASNSVNTGIVTGIFLRHSMDVRTYTFQSLTTGRLNKINATPEHPFYVTNLHTWMPLYKITPSMLLTDNHNNPVMLRCRGDRQYHCGVSLYPRKIRTVYNIEVYKKHAYHVGGLFLLAHNYGLTLESTGHFSGIDTLESMLIRKLAEPLLDDSAQKIIRDLSEGERLYSDQKMAHMAFLKQAEKAAREHNLRMKSYGLLSHKLDPPFLSSTFYNDALIIKFSNTEVRGAVGNYSIGVSYKVSRDENSSFIATSGVRVVPYRLELAKFIRKDRFMSYYESNKYAQPRIVGDGNLGRFCTAVEAEYLTSKIIVTPAERIMDRILDIVTSSLRSWY